MTSLFLLCALAAAPARAADPAISFMASDKVVLSVTASELRARPDARIVTLTDPYYGKRKRYRAVPIKDLLTQAFGPEWIEDGVGEIFFTASDGYDSHARAPTLAEEGGMIAFEDEDAPNWEELPKEKIRPGPFYLVWTGAEQTPQKGYPWPWQLVSVKSAIIEDEYPKAVPRKAGLYSRAPAGWAVFKRYCISCHAMNGQGGTVGPDLNEPRGITRYRDKKQLRAYIQKPSSFRHTKMPDFDQLSEYDLDGLMAYFEFMTVQAGTK